MLSCKAIWSPSELAQILRSWSLPQSAVPGAGDCRRPRPPATAREASPGAGAARRGDGSGCARTASPLRTRRNAKPSRTRGARHAPRRRLCRKHSWCPGLRMRMLLSATVCASLPGRRRGPAQASSGALVVAAIVSRARCASSCRHVAGVPGTFGSGWSSLKVWSASAGCGGSHRPQSSAHPAPPVKWRPWVEPRQRSWRRGVIGRLDACRTVSARQRQRGTISACAQLQAAGHKASLSEYGGGGAGGTLLVAAMTKSPPIYRGGGRCCTPTSLDACEAPTRRAVGTGG